MPADDSLLAQGTVEFRNEERAHRWRADVTAYADEHESGQLRLACAGEQVSLLPLPDDLIPTMQDEEV